MSSSPEQGNFPIEFDNGEGVIGAPRSSNLQRLMRAVQCRNKKAGESSRDRLTLLVVVALCVLDAGCASIVPGTNQSLSIETRNNGEAVNNANCKLHNDKGTGFVTTPGSVTVNRSFTVHRGDGANDGTCAGCVRAVGRRRGGRLRGRIYGGIRECR